jgi:DNA-3-methyladenine glycosylase
MHYCFNVVTEPEGRPAAVLVRALRPEAGLDRMQARRGGREGPELTQGPARLCEALGIDLDQNDTSLAGPVLSVRSDGARVARIASGPRVGIRVAMDRPWRFWVEGDPFVSRARPVAPKRRRG